MIELSKNPLADPNSWNTRLLILRALWLSRFGKNRLARNIHNILYLALRNRFRPGVARLDGFEIAYRDAFTLYIEAFYIWYKQIYCFELGEPVSYILDCGASIGTSALYFRQHYPDARIVSFEPEPEQFSLLTENLKRNQVRGIEPMRVALGANEGTTWFRVSRGHGGQIVSQEDPNTIQVPVRCLSEWIDREVDILKMNIEGSENEVLHEIEPHIDRCKNIVFEYHHILNQDATLHEILTLLNRNNFIYGINHFDSLINPTLQTPIALTPQTKYYLLVFACRRQ